MWGSFLTMSAENRKGRSDWFVCTLKENVSKYWESTVIFFFSTQLLFSSNANFESYSGRHPDLIPQGSFQIILVQNWTKLEWPSYTDHTLNRMMNSTLCTLLEELVTSAINLPYVNFVAAVGLGLRWAACLSRQQLSSFIHDYVSSPLCVTTASTVANAGVCHVTMDHLASVLCSYYVIPVSLGAAT